MTPAERDEIEGRVRLIEPELLVLCELPVQTPLSVDIMHERVEALTAGLSGFAVIVDLRSAHRPNSPTRQALKRNIERVAPRVLHTAFIVEHNIIMAAMARLVAISYGYRSVSVHHTFEEAVAEARSALGR